MLRLKDGITLEDLKSFGFYSSKQSGFTRYYKCVPNGVQLIMVSVEDKTTPDYLKPYINRELIIDKWYDQDPRIHSKPKY